MGSYTFNFNNRVNDRPVYELELLTLDFISEDHISIIAMSRAWNENNKTVAGKVTESSPVLFFAN